MQYEIIQCYNAKEFRSVTRVTPALWLLGVAATLSAQVTIGNAGKPVIPAFGDISVKSLFSNVRII